MPQCVEFNEFQEKIGSVPGIMAFVELVAGEAEQKEIAGAQRDLDPVSVSLSLVVVAALWKLINIGISTLKRMSEDATVQCRIELIKQLQEMGYNRQAPLILERMIREMRERPDNDQMLKKLTDMFLS